MLMIALSVALVAASVLLTFVASMTIAHMLYAWRTVSSLHDTRFPPAADAAHSFTLLVPAYDEELVLASTLDGLLNIDHPAYEVIVIVREDDPGTAAVARHYAETRPDVIRMLQYNYNPRNKPAAMNLALGLASNEIIGIFDAEDEVHPSLLAKVDALWQAHPDVDVVQSGVQLMNFWSSWYSVRNVLEYYFWFRSRLHYHAAARFIPLGGNTVFMRADVLRGAEGWDDSCLAEDCEVGVRLSSAGHKVAVAYDPELVTREETPSSVGELIRQRTRWNQGFLQVLAKRDWKKLPTRRQRLLAVYTLVTPFLQAFTGILIPFAVVSALLLNVPILVAMFSFVPLVPTFTTVVIEVFALREFGHTFGLKVRIRDYVRLVVGTPFYQAVLGYAAARAVWREKVLHEGGWEKSSHANLHRDPASQSHQRWPVPAEEVRR